MFSNYLKIAWRNLTRNKTFSAINIIGLSFGLACSILIMLWVISERSVDAFHANNDRLFVVYERQYYDGKIEAGYPTQGMLAEELKKSFPEIQYAAAKEYAAAPGSLNTFQANDKVLKMSGCFAGDDFFRMFTYPLLEGNPESAIAEENTVAISKKMAEAFFGSQQAAIGKAIKFENKYNLQITAVFDNVPVNSSDQFDFVRNWKDFVKDNDWVHHWGNASPVTYVQLRSDANRSLVESKIKDFVHRFTPKNEGFRVELALQPYSERYLHSRFQNGNIDGGRIEYVRLFTIVAIIILIIACINFMNLATARSASRSKEVAVRKVIGAGKGMLVRQFMVEAFVLTLISAMASLLLASLFLPVFNQLSLKQLFLPIEVPKFWMAFIALLLVTTCIAGTYPALFLSTFQPVKILKGSLKFSWRTVFFRKGLVVFQFAISIILILGVIVIFRQMNYVQSKNLGYDRENLVYVPIEGDLVNRYSLFKQQMLSHPSIAGISKMRNSPTVIEHHTGSISWPGKPDGSEVSFADGVVGYDFLKTMKLQLKDGRDFSPLYNDSASYMLNETAVAKMGLDNAVGKIVSWGNRPGKVIGVVKDFHFNSMHQTIEPLIMRLDEHWTWGTILVRTKPGQTKQAIDDLRKVCRELNPSVPFTYQFSDQEFAKLYSSEETVGKLSSYFAFLAIFISCLGLFGMAMFAAAQRTKEIGVRKVLGASVRDVIRLLTANFLKPVAIAMIISFPIAHYLLNQWLSNFAYRIDIEWWMYAIGGGIALLIAIITVSSQAIKAAMINPVKSLRSE